MIKEAISNLSLGKNLSSAETEEVMDEIMSEKATPAQIAAFLLALNIKGESIEEIIGGTKGILKKAVQIRTKNKDLVDLCGTGGDGHSTFNISTLSSFVTAGAGSRVAKHGNRSISSQCGSADLLEALGVNFNLPSRKIAQSIDGIGFGFLFAPRFHPAMKYALQPRREIGLRTIFNIIGPLANPLKVKRQLVGVYSADLLIPVSRALKLMGKQKALVVHSMDGLDEISISAPTLGYLVSKEKSAEIKITPEDFRLKRRPLKEIQAFSVKENIEIFYKVLQGEKGAIRDVVLLNSGAALFVAGKATDIKEGIERAQDSIDSSKALRLFHQFLSFTKENEND